jgi:hypothetical protein
VAANTLPERHSGLPRDERAQLAGVWSKAWPGYQGPAKAAGEVVRMAAQEEQSLSGEDVGSGAVLRGGGGGEATAHRVGS